MRGGCWTGEGQRRSGQCSRGNAKKRRNFSRAGKFLLKSRSKTAVWGEKSEDKNRANTRTVRKKAKIGGDKGTVKQRTRREDKPYLFHWEEN